MEGNCCFFPVFKVLTRVPELRLLSRFLKNILKKKRLVTEILFSSLTEVHDDLSSVHDYFFFFSAYASTLKSKSTLIVFCQQRKKFT